MCHPLSYFPALNAGKHFLGSCGLLNHQCFSSKCLLRKRHLEPQTGIKKSCPAGDVLLKSSHHDFLEKNKGFESRLHEEAEEGSFLPH